MWEHRSKPLKKDSRIWEQGANRSKETRDFESKEETAPKEQKKEQTVRKRLENFVNKEQAARKELDKLRTRSKSLNKD